MQREATFASVATTKNDFAGIVEVDVNVDALLPIKGE
jgi:hypothetical protein